MLLLAPGNQKNLVTPLSTATIILDPGTTWRTQVSFTPRHFQLAQAYIIIDFILTKFVVSLQRTKQIRITINILYQCSQHLEVNADKTKYMIMSRDQNAERSHSVKTDNSSIERVEEFEYLGTTLTDQNSIQEEIKSRLKLGNACYYSV